MHCMMQYDYPFDKEKHQYSSMLQQTVLSFYTIRFIVYGLTGYY